jgi:hypothetical protein
MTLTSFGLILDRNDRRQRLEGALFRMAALLAGISNKTAELLGSEISAR